MASPRGRSNSPKPLGSAPPASKPSSQDAPNGNTTKTSPRSRSPSSSRRSSRAGSVKSRRSDSRSMSLSRSSSDSRSRSRSYSSSRSRSPRRKRGRSYSRSPSRSRSRSYSSYSSRSDSRGSTKETGAGSKVIEISKLTKNVSVQHIREIFGVYGKVKEVDLPIIKRIGSHKGTAVVTFESEKAAQKAITHMDRGQLDGSLISVQVYRPPSPPRGPAALRRGGNSYRGPPDSGNRYAVNRGSNASRRNVSPPRRSFAGRSRSPPRRSFAESRPAGRSNRSRTPPYRRKRSLSRSPTRSPRRNARRSSPQYAGRSRRNRSFSRSGSSSYTRSSISRSRSPRR